MSVARFGVSLEEELLTWLDAYVINNKFPNRSQAIRHLIEKSMVEKKWQCNNIVAGAVVLSYNHQKTDIPSKLNELQFKYKDIVLSSTNLIINHEKCLQIVAVKGTSYRLTEFSDMLISLKGVDHGKLVMSMVE